MILIFALIWPFATLVLSIRDFKYRDFVIGVLSVSVMVGLCEQIIETESFQADITRNLAHVVSYKYLPWRAIFLERDYFLGISGKLLCVISDNLRFLAVCYTLIKALLFLRCVKIVLDHIVDSERRISLLPLLAMLFVVSFYDINSLRFSIASVYFLWCSLEILIIRRKLFYVLLLLSPFIHFGFWIMAPVPLLFFLLKDRTRIVWLVFILSFIFSTARTSLWISQYVEENMSESIAESVESYASESGLEGMTERYEEGARLGNLNRAISRAAVDIRNYGIMIITMLFSFLGFKRRQPNDSFNQLINYLIIVYSCANIANSNSQGTRFYLVAAMIAVFIFVYIMYRDEKWYIDFYTNNNSLVNIAFILVVLTGVIYLYVGRDLFNLWGVLFGNYLIHF